MARPKTRNAAGHDDSDDSNDSDDEEYHEYGHAEEDGEIVDLSSTSEESAYAESDIDSDGIESGDSDDSEYDDDEEDEDQNGARRRRRTNGRGKKHAERQQQQLQHDTKNGEQQSLRSRIMGKRTPSLHDHEVEQILGRRMSQQQHAGGEEVPRRGMAFSAQYEYLVKFKYASHWHNQWVNGVDLHNAAYYKLKAFERVHPVRLGEEMNLMDTNWTMVEQIVDRQIMHGQDMVLVKWYSLEHKECTWEPSTTVQQHGNASRHLLQLFLSRKPYAPISNTMVPQMRNQPLKKQPANLGTEKFRMHDYQLVGLNWLVGKFYARTNVILADEMGLGKTVQTISVCAKLHEDGFNGPYLIVVPLSTLPNWQREFETWASHLNVIVYNGRTDSRNVIRKHAVFTTRTQGEKKTQLLQPNVILTTYEYTVNDLSFFASLNWRMVVIDEGHRLKNSKSKLLIGLKQIKTSFRLLLTGTPLQNNLTELWTLLNFLNPMRFNSLESFMSEFADLNKEDTMNKIHQVVKPHMLRRLKKDVVQHLPSKTELLVKVKLTSLQKVFYKKVLTKNYTDLSQGLGLGKAQYLRSFNNIVMQLRNVCNHPYLFFDSVEQEPSAENEDMAIHHMIMASGKMILLDKMLAKLKERGHRVLIYSQRTRILDIIEDYLLQRKYKYLRIDGNTKSAERQKRIDKYSKPGSDYFVFVLTTRAGGVGINLQAADTVIIYDSDWNPHMDLQAMARVHRIGQTKKVMVYRLACENTIEERVLEVAAQKKLLETIVVRKMSQLNDIIKHGASEILSSSDTKEDLDDKELIVQSSLQSVGFTDTEIDNLLDLRNDIAPAEEADHQQQVSSSSSLTPPNDKNKFNSLKVSEYELPQKFSGITDYSVADYDGGNDNDDEDFSADKINDDVDPDKVKAEADFWKSLLAEKVEHEKDLEEEHRRQEIERRKKRKRKFMKAIQHDPLHNVLEDNDNDDDDSNDDSYEGGNSEDEEYDANMESMSKKRRAETNGTPSLMEGEGKDLKILGFNIREREAFTRLLLRFGSGRHTDNEYQFLYDRARNDSSLKFKSLESLERYCKLVWSHIEEHSNGLDYSATSYADGCPVEFDCREILFRFSLIHIIHQKIEKYANQVDSFDILEVPGRKQSLHRSWKNEDFPWKRKHDYYFLKGILKYGYRRWKPIFTDPELGLGPVMEIIFAQRARSKKNKDAGTTEREEHRNDNGKGTSEHDGTAPSNEHQTGEAVEGSESSQKATASSSSSADAKKQLMTFQLKANNFLKKRIKDIETALEKEYEYINHVANNPNGKTNANATDSSSSNGEPCTHVSNTSTQQQQDQPLVPYVWIGKLLIREMTTVPDREICYLAAYYIGPDESVSGHEGLLVNRWPSSMIFDTELQVLDNANVFENVFCDNTNTACVWRPAFQTDPSTAERQQKERFFDMLVQKMIENCAFKMIPLNDENVLFLFPAQLCETLKAYHLVENLPSLASIVLPSNSLSALVNDK